MLAAMPVSVVGAAWACSDEVHEWRVVATQYLKVVPMHLPKRTDVVRN